MAASGPGLQLRAMSWPVTLVEPGSELMSVAHITFEGCADARGLSGAMLVSEGYAANRALQSEWPAMPPGGKVTSKPGIY